MMNINLNNKHALVCGASRGIGRACAEALAELGANVTLVARNADALESVAGSLSGGSHQWLALDFAEPETMAAEMREHLERHPAQIVINNTGGPPPGPAVEAGPEAFLEGFRRHLICNQLIVQAALPGMREAGYGRIVNIVSTSVYEPIPGLGVSNTVRAAVAGWAKTLSRELGPEGFTVNNVLPGFTATGRLDALIRGKAQKAGISEDEQAARMKAGVPLGRFAEPEEIAAAVAFLASPAGSYMSGVSLAVDGGRLQSI